MVYTAAMALIISVVSAMALLQGVTRWHQKRALSALLHVTFAFMLSLGTVGYSINAVLHDISGQIGAHNITLVPPDQR